MKLKTGDLQERGGIFLDTSNGVKCSGRPVYGRGGQDAQTKSTVGGVPLFVLVCLSHSHE